MYTHLLHKHLDATINDMSFVIIESFNDLLQCNIKEKINGPFQLLQLSQGDVMLIDIEGQEKDLFPNMAATDYWHQELLEMKMYTYVNDFIAGPAVVVKKHVWDVICSDYNIIKAI